MGRLSARSNPTNLKEIDRNRVNISISEINGQRSFILDKFDLTGLELSENLKLICLASAGPTSLRFELGKASSWTRENQSLDGLDRSASLRFRILMHEEDNPRLVASVENLRPRDDSQSESLLPMEPANLGERLWRLELREEGPVLQFNASVFPSAAGVENYFPFSAFVLPEALSQVIEFLANDPEKLNDDNDEWSAWGGWLDSIGASRPPSDEEDEYAKKTWCQDTLGIFCDRHRFASRLLEELKRGEQE
jgi:hypothetical protein